MWRVVFILNFIPQVFNRVSGIVCGYAMESVEKFVGEVLKVEDILL